MERIDPNQPEKEFSTHSTGSRSPFDRYDFQFGERFFSRAGPEQRDQCGTIYWRLPGDSVRRFLLERLLIGDLLLLK